MRHPTKQTPGLQDKPWCGCENYFIEMVRADNKRKYNKSTFSSINRNIKYYPLYILPAMVAIAAIISIVFIVL